MELLEHQIVQDRNEAEQRVAALQKDHGETEAANRRIEQLEQESKLMSQQLDHAERLVLELQQEAAERLDNEEQWQDSLVDKQKEQNSLLQQAQVAADESELLRKQTEDRCLLLEQELDKERSTALQQMEHLQQLVQKSQEQNANIETEMKKKLKKKETALSKSQKQQERAVQMAEDKMVQSMAMLDERDSEIGNLKTVIADLRATISNSEKGVKEVEDEADELHAENEELVQRLQAMEKERSEMTSKLLAMQSDHDTLEGLQMELHLLKEERERDRAHKQSTTESLETNQAMVANERDAALAEARDLQQQLAAARADLDVARADVERAATSSGNLQYALEAFQAERDAEIGIMEEQRKEQEEGTAAAHAAAILAINETNQAHMNQIQQAADSAVKNVMAEVNSLETKCEEQRKENVQLRRSLDEAIHRLSLSQDDVVDRQLMKNILLDWFSKSGKGKKQVLEVMASLLHFSEEEKDNIHLTEFNLNRVVEAVAAPLPPAKADVENLEGENVREKWVNFLLSETDGDTN